MLLPSATQPSLSAPTPCPQIALLIAVKGGGAHVAPTAGAFQYLRLTRLVRFARILRQLVVLTVGSGSGSFLPGAGAECCCSCLGASPRAAAPAHHTTSSIPCPLTSPAGLRIPPQIAHALNVGYSSMVLLHFFACLWCAGGVNQGSAVTACKHQLSAAPPAFAALHTRRNFIALKEGFTGTWLNSVPALVHQHSADGASPLSAEELEAVGEWPRYVLGLYFSTVTIATLGYGECQPGE